MAWTWTKARGGALSALIQLSMQALCRLQTGCLSKRLPLQWPTGSSMVCRVISLEERASILQQLGGSAYQVGGLSLMLPRDQNCITRIARSKVACNVFVSLRHTAVHD